MSEFTTTYSNRLQMPGQTLISRLSIVSSSPELGCTPLVSQRVKLQLRASTPLCKLSTQRFMPQPRKFHLVQSHRLSPYLLKSLSKSLRLNVYTLSPRALWCTVYTGDFQNASFDARVIMFYLGLQVMMEFRGGFNS